MEFGGEPMMEARRAAVSSLGIEQNPADNRAPIGIPSLDKIIEG